MCGDGPSLEGAVRDTSAFKLLPAIADNSPGATRSAGARDSGGKPLTAQDVRFTTKGGALYAFVMGWPGREAVIPSLAISVKAGVGKIQNVELLGAGKVPFTQDETALRLQLPEKQPSQHAIAFKINGA
jgi:alpha-L-fucosidase